MIDLYTWGTPNGRKVQIALAELDIPHTLHPVNIGKDEQFAPEFLKIAPNNKIPAIVDNETGTHLVESGAILLHLAEKHGKLLSSDPRRRIEAIQYAFFQTGGIGPNLGRFGAAIRKPEEERNAEMIQIFGDEVTRLLGVLDRILSDGRLFLAGEYSIGDIMHYGWLAIPLALKFPQLMEFPRVVAWLGRIGERPAVQRGMAVPE